MTQHTSPNDSSTYSNKTRGTTHTRVSRVRVTTVGKGGKGPLPEKQHRSCPRCKESTSSMKMLTSRVERIEQLVDNLAKTTRGLASASKREDRIQYNLRYNKGMDLTHCSLEELQKLVVTTTNFMQKNNSMKPNINSKISSNIINNTNSNTKDKTLTEITINTNNEKEILHEDPMEDIKIFPKVNNDHRQSSFPIKTTTSSLKREVLRQDSGFEDGPLPLPLPLPEKK